jgi:hypothetical protein
MDFYPAVATKQEPTYSDAVLATESPPWDGPFPYSSSQDPSLVLPLFYLEVSPEDWDWYERWWRSAVGLDGSKVLVRFGTNQVLIQDAVTLRPVEWLADNILYYFTHSLKRISRSRTPSSYSFLPASWPSCSTKVTPTRIWKISSATKTLQPGGRKKRTCLKTSLQEVKMLVFFRNKGSMHWVTYIIFQDLKIIEEFDAMGSSNTNILKGLYHWVPKNWNTSPF